MYVTWDPSAAVVVYVTINSHEKVLGHAGLLG